MSRAVNGGPAGGWNSRVFRRAEVFDRLNAAEHFRTIRCLAPDNRAGGIRELMDPEGRLL